MPAVTVLPLVNSTVTATYKDIASASVPTNAKPAALEVREVRSKALSKSSSPLKEGGGASGNPTKPSNNPVPIMESSGPNAQEGSKTDLSKGDTNQATESNTNPEQVVDLETSRGNVAGKDGNSTTGTASPSQSSSSIPHVIHSQGTPQQGYYVAYNSQVTPEPPSPHTTGGATVYDVGSFFQQASGFQSSPFAAVPAHPYGPAATGHPHPPASPNSQSIPPASPLFPRVTNPTTAALLGAARGELSPGPPYVSSGGSTEEFSAWGDTRTMQSSYPPSPQISAQGIPIPYVPGMPLPRSVSDRSASFDESMLPQSADSVGFSAVQAGGIGAGTLFAHQQPWGYGAPHDMYGASSPLQARPTVPYPGQLGGPPRHHHPSHMPPYGGQYFPAASPGPPIQTTASNKGPDGANLFIFHIPNHFTNVDMYQLFYPYGNLLSVRIMVEKDSGRSRGFGFVSYDSPDAAALAIKELNGYAIGNKRLKVQHKQIRPSDQQYDRGQGGEPYNDGQYNHNAGGAYGGGGRGMNLPPSGPMAASVGWYNRQGQNGPSGPMPQNTGIAAGLNQTYGGEDAAASAAGSTSDAPPPNGQEDAATGSDPLSNMEPLRQSLPDVGNGAATSAVEGEI